MITELSSLSEHTQQLSGSESDFERSRFLDASGNVDIDVISTADMVRIKNCSLVRSSSLSVTPSLKNVIMTRRMRWKCCSRKSSEDNWNSDVDSVQLLIESNECVRKWRIHTHQDQNKIDHSRSELFSNHVGIDPEKYVHSSWSKTYDDSLDYWSLLHESIDSVYSVSAQKIVAWILN